MSTLLCKPVVETEHMHGMQNSLCNVDHWGSRGAKVCGTQVFVWKTANSLASPKCCYTEVGLITEKQLRGSGSNCLSLVEAPTTRNLRLPSTD